MEVQYSKKALEQYFNDVYTLISKRLNIVAQKKPLGKYEERRLVALIHELFYIKSLLEERENN